MYVLGIDIGSVNFASSVISTEPLRIEDTSYFNLGGKTIGQKMVFLEIELSKIIEDHQVDFILFENSKFQGRSAPSLHYVCGLVYLVGEKLKVPVVPVTPTEVKKYITGKGTASKLEIDLELKKIFNRTENFENDHVSDSLGVALCYGLYSGRNSNN